MFLASFGFLSTGIISISDPRWGVHLNREIEVNHAHTNYQHEFMPRRNRLTHSLLFEEFEMILEDWEKLGLRYADNSKYGC